MLVYKNSLHALAIFVGTLDVNIRNLHVPLDFVLMSPLSSPFQQTIFQRPFRRMLHRIAPIFISSHSLAECVMFCVCKRAHPFRIICIRPLSMITAEPLMFKKL
jgi:hypothetical protein